MPELTQPTPLLPIVEQTLDSLVERILVNAVNLDKEATQISKDALKKYVQGLMDGARLAGADAAAKTVKVDAVSETLAEHDPHRVACPACMAPIGKNCTQPDATRRGRHEVAWSHISRMDMAVRS